VSSAVRRAGALTVRPVTTCLVLALALPAGTESTANDRVRRASTASTVDSAVTAPVTTAVTTAMTTAVTTAHGPATRSMDNVQQRRR